MKRTIWIFKDKNKLEKKNILGITPDNHILLSNILNEYTQCHLKFAMFGNTRKDLSDYKRRYPDNCKDFKIVKIEI